LATACKGCASDARKIDIELFAEFACQMRECGPANFMFASEGRLLVHADRRTQGPGVIESPGLWMLQRACAPTSQFTGGGVTVEGSVLTVVLVASVPLSAEAWQPLPRGAVLALERGHVIRMMQL
jgi:glutamine amidotransferase